MPSIFSLPRLTSKLASVFACLFSMMLFLVRRFGDAGRLFSRLRPGLPVVLPRPSDGLLNLSLTYIQPINYGLGFVENWTGNRFVGRRLAAGRPSEGRRKTAGILREGRRKTVGRPLGCRRRAAGRLREGCGKAAGVRTRSLRRVASRGGRARWRLCADAWSCRCFGNGGFLE